MLEHNETKLKNKRRYRGGLLLTLRLHTTLLTFATVFLVGVFLGSVVPSLLERNSYRGVSQILGNFLSQRQSQPMSATFASALAPNAIFWAILLLCGFCAVSAPLILLVMLCKGMGYGLFAATLIGQYGAGALRYLSVSILPNLLISTLTLLFCCREAHRMSKSIWQMMRPQARGGGEEGSAGEFGAKMILYGVFLCLGAAIEAYLCASSIVGLL